ncbi:hypothetical protein [Halorhabdus rudnickae]|uniref:hypothetical protein n=1 Tax=Halorhabdus rudnickae TaxID=1775544 RepID=UPI001083EDF7|nr:hypothetical protein [Halorhabdus rudnickae]
MGVTPDIPDGTPHEVNGWTLDPEPYNGLPWFGDDGRVSVLVSASISGNVYAKVNDERASGAYEYLLGDGDESYSLERAVSEVVGWMERNDPEEWHHPRLEPSAFDIPEGYSLDIYSLGKQKTSIRYELDDCPEAVRVVRIRIEGYDSTDNWTVEINRTPITRGHGEEIWDPEKGTDLLDVLARVRRVATAIEANPSTVTVPDRGELDIEQFTSNAPTPSQPSSGQMELGHFGGEA